MSGACVPTLLSVNNYFYRRGGAEAVFLSQNDMLQKKGWKVIPFAMQHEKNMKTVYAEHFADEIEFGQSYGVVQKVKMAAKIIYSFEARKKIEHCIDQTAPDIAHLHNVYHHLSPSIISGLKHKKVPIVMTLHDLKIACPAYKMLSHDGVCERCKSGNVWPLLKQKCIKGSRVLSTLIAIESSVHRMLKLYEQVDRFIVPSQFYLEKFVEWGWDRDKFVYIPNCIDVVNFEAKYTVGEAFVYFGRLSEEKGVMTLLKAAKLASVTLEIVGEGEMTAQAKAYAQAHNIKVTFHGFQSGENLYAIIRRARAVVLPSEWYENAPISILEAYALGTPVIGANIGGIPEMVREGETGVLFPYGDSEALAQTLLSFQSMPEEQLSAMGKSARVWVEASFSTSSYQKSLLSLYQILGVKSC